MTTGLAAVGQGLELLILAASDRLTDVRRPVHRSQEATASAGDGQHVPGTLHDAVARDQQVGALEEGVQLVVGGDGRRGIVGGTRMHPAPAGKNHLPVGRGAEANIDLWFVRSMVPRVAEFDPTAAFVGAVEEDGGQIVVNGFHGQLEALHGLQGYLGSNLLPVRINGQQGIDQPVVVEQARVGDIQKQVQAGLFRPRRDVAQGTGRQQAIDDQDGEDGTFR